MTWAVVFKGLEVHKIYDDISKDWPGTFYMTNKGFNYVVFSSGDWYCLTGIFRNGITEKVSEETVPPELRAIALLLEIPA